MKKLIRIISGIVSVSIMASSFCACDSSRQTVREPAETEETAGTDETANPVEDLPALQDEDEVFANCEEVTFGDWRGEEIVWLVLEENDRGTLLLSKQVLFMYEFGCEAEPYTWQNSSIRSVLNDNFYNTAFSQEQQRRILGNAVHVTDSDDGEDLQRDPTYDNIFLLDINELREYCPEVIATPYCTAASDALENGAVNDGGYGCSWWLRGPVTHGTAADGNEFYMAPVVDGVTDADQGSYNASSCTGGVMCGVRPVMWVDLDDDGDDSSSDNPYVDVIPGPDDSSGAIVNGEYTYTLCEGTPDETQISCNIDINEYLYEGDDHMDHFDFPRLCEELGWTMYDGQTGSDQYLGGFIEAVAYDDEELGLRTAIVVDTRDDRYNQIMDFSMLFLQCNEGYIFPCTEYYPYNTGDGEEVSEDRYAPKFIFDTHEIDYIVDGLGADVFTGENIYGLTSDELVLLVYAMASVPKKEITGVNPYYYIDLPCEQVRVINTMVYDFQ